MWDPPTGNDPADTTRRAIVVVRRSWFRDEIENLRQRDSKFDVDYDRPTPEKLALDDAGLMERASKRLGGDPARVIDAFRTAYPKATPWDLYILIATDHPRGTYTRELGKRKAMTW